MSAPIFNGKVVLNTVTETSGGALTTWNGTFTFSDNSGAWLASGVSVGNVIVLDTSILELGSFTSFVITAVTSFDDSLGEFTVSFEYAASNANVTGAPDVNACIGIPGVVAARSLLQNLAGVPYAGLQQLPDSFLAHISNDNAFQIIDKITGALPDQTGSAGFFLTTDGSTPSWAAIDGVGNPSGGTGSPLDTTLIASAYTYNADDMISVAVDTYATATLTSTYTYDTDQNMVQAVLVLDDAGAGTITTRTETYTYVNNQVTAMSAVIT